MLRQTLQLTACLFAANLLLACSSHDSDTASDTAEAPADTPAAADQRTPTVFDDQLKALDKAKAVEETLKKAQADRDKQIDEQSGG
jgi:hypothetical protein